MTHAERSKWIECGEIVLTCTLVILFAGAVSARAGQTIGLSDQVLHQATAAATASADIRALTERVGKVENQINYVLAAIVGSILAQLFQLRANQR